MSIRSYTPAHHLLQLVLFDLVEVYAFLWQHLIPQFSFPDSPIKASVCLGQVWRINQVFTNSKIKIQYHKSKETNTVPLEDNITLTFVPLSSYVAN